MLPLLAAALAAGPLLAAGPCVPSQTQDITAEARCVKSDGISIGIGEEDAAKVACLQSKKVQNLCGPDGSLTRLRAFQTWIKRLKQFEDSCAAKGGTFSYQDANFVEPADESFCSAAVPEIHTSMFEEPLCNFHSACPSVSVLCERECRDAVIPNHL